MYKNPTDFYLTVIRNPEAATILADFWRQCQLSAEKTPSPDTANSLSAAVAAICSPSASPPSLPVETLSSVVSINVSGSAPGLKERRPSGFVHPSGDSFVSATEQVVLTISPATSLNSTLQTVPSGMARMGKALSMARKSSGNSGPESGTGELIDTAQAPMWHQVRNTRELESRKTEFKFSSN